MGLAEIFLRRGMGAGKVAMVFSAPFVIALLILLAAIMAVDTRAHNLYFEMQLMETSRAYFDQILLARLWNAEHGGLYAEVTEKTQPNPYLDDPERDIVSEKGRRYTKINPAFMTRQLSEMAAERGSYRFRITDLRPLNPVNMPSEWEAGMLRSFERGEPEGHGFVELEGEEYFGYMAPLRIEKPCLKCHTEKNYRVGDLRGGISVYVPVERMRAIHESLIRNDRWILGFTGLLAVSFIVGIVWFFSKRLKEGMTKELEAEGLRAAVKLAGGAAHELRQPLTVIMGVSEEFKSKTSGDLELTRDAEMVVEACERMDAIIERMLNITSYKTKPYGKDTEIFDLGPEGRRQRDS